MGSTSVTPLDPRDKITICLAGYIAIRTQTLQRNIMVYQAFAIAGTTLLAIGALVLTRSLAIGLGLGATLALIVLLTFRFNRSDSLATARRLEELRLRINRLANDELLKPETAGAVMDYLPKLQDAIQPLGDMGLILRRLWHRGAGAWTTKVVR